ncbi:uncharacterized protein LOC104884059 [Beta vulgaris subsp. vulgaris]|uniref:uncharacterized protein LOC104884059 n=1 Tax=Beta vulgaris subsp. vulgaris TaxID=3555 RepID=UPI00053FFE03|nr:uncharacterized protein LOC104884059 [Beta vulgaris subsp. vulgaris]
MKGRCRRAEWEMKFFRDTVDVCGFREVPWSGYEFAYDNERLEADNVQCRLDRALADNDWLNLFPASHLFKMDKEWSYHALLKLVFKNREGYVGLGPKPFRFEQISADDETCENVIAISSEFGGSTFDSKLSFCAGELREWGQKKFGQAFRELKKKRKILSMLNGGSLSASQMDQRRKLVRDIENMVRVEEVFWRQSRRPFGFGKETETSKFSISVLQVKNAKTPFHASKMTMGLNIQAIRMLESCCGLFLRFVLYFQPYGCRCGTT